MDDKQLQALANELAKNLKTPEDLSQFDCRFNLSMQHPFQLSLSVF